jgi:protein-L-isoaspartate(D-aspartate) O-methyltransferase
MVERQLRRRGIEDERVLEAMGAVPRELFVPAHLRRRAYRDGALQIGAGQTISQPWIVARMAELLELQGRERVLEVGTGSGYAAAVLGVLAREGEVVTVERHEPLARDAAALLERLGLTSVEVRVGDGALGAPDKAPFDAISVAAAAAGAPPPALQEQLRPGGTLVCPVEREGQELLVRYRDGHAEPIVPVRFVPLVEEP